MSDENKPMIFTEITIVRGEGTQNEDGSVTWAKKPIEKRGLLVQEKDTFTVKLVAELKFMIANVIGEVYKVWQAAKHGN